MSSVIAEIHSALSKVFSALWALLSFASPGWQLVVVSVVFGIIMVLVYGRVSNQNAIRRVKEQISASLLEVVLFRRDVRISLGAQLSLLIAGIRYFLLAMGPVLILAVPFALILGHVNLRLGARPLAPGEEAILAVNVKKGTDLKSVHLSVGDGLAVVGPVRVPKTSSVFWRVAPRKDGETPLRLSVGSNSAITEDVVSGPQSTTPAAGIFLTSSDWPEQLLFPNGGSGQSLTAAPFETVELTYPQREYSFAGVTMSWITAFLVISICAGYAGSRLFGISV